MINRDYGFLPKKDWKAARQDRKTLDDWTHGRISTEEACKQITNNNNLKREINEYQLMSYARACCYYR